MVKVVNLDDLGNIEGKRVLIRLDLNVPMKGKEVTSNERIVRSLPTLKELIEKKAKVIVLSHLGRPEGNGYQEDLSLEPVAKELEKALKHKVHFVKDCVGAEVAQAVSKLENGSVLMLDNLRFYKAETKNDPDFVRQLAENGDIYVSDAFSAAHRAHASTEGLAHVLPYAAGRLMQAELEALEKALSNPLKPVVAIVGGAKVSTKLNVLDNLSKKVEYIIVGGGMANTFLYSLGVNMQNSLHEKDMKDDCLKIIETAKQHGCQLVLPCDFRGAKDLNAGFKVIKGKNGEIPEGHESFDAGDQSVENFLDTIRKCKTVIWNGPVGVFEVAPFDTGTLALANEIAKLTKESKLISIAGGGDTIASLYKANVYDDLTYVSTAGGAFLEWMEGKELPGVTCLLVK